SLDRERSSNFSVKIRLLYCSFVAVDQSILISFRCSVIKKRDGLRTRQHSIALFAKYCKLKGIKNFLNFLIGRTPPFPSLARCSVEESTFIFKMAEHKKIFVFSML
ncbi:MAG: hypothetical protein NTX36_10785, partial [Proteobacteria bacterium]|nr:hypothetical protein [Pseudomonadota bacterium]